MKKLILLIPIALMINSCSQVDGTNPSQNKTLNMLGGKTEKKIGFLQSSLDNWLKTEWEPTTSSPTKPNEDGSAKLIEIKTGIVLKELTKRELLRQEEIKTKYKEKDRNFTLQEYIDKLSIYNYSHIANEKNSHYNKINNMAIVGKVKK